MKTTTKPVEGKREFNLKEAFVLWKTTAKSGLEYLTGKTTEETPVKLIAYFNGTKKNPNEPDIRIYSVNEKGEKDLEVASLWDTLDKNEKQYLTGSTNEKEKLVGWYSKEENEKRPYIRIYYK